MDINYFDRIFKNCKNKHLYVGFSGGADSTLALYLCNYYKDKYNFQVTAVHIDHQLRGENSDNDHMHCVNFCKKYNINIRVFCLGLTEQPSIEAIAREARHNIWKQISNVDKKAVIILGHHLDDNIENFFIRMSRGSNLSGLLGLRESYDINGAYIIRPLLDISKQDIVNYLNSQNIDWITDNSNCENVYYRNYIRNVFLTNWYNQHDFIYSGVKQSINALSDDLDFIEQTVEQHFNTIIDKQDVPFTFWKTLHKAIMVRVLRKWINVVIPDFTLTKSFIDQFYKILNNFNNTGIKQLNINDKYMLRFRNYIVTIVVI